MVATLLAALKLGAAYVSLDPRYPTERLASILEDAAPAAVVARRDLIARLPRGTAALTLESLTADDAPPPSIDVDPRQLAYLLFTSGSTGRPKGVAIAHEAASRMVQWAGEVFDAEELAGVLAATSINFDLSVFELFVPLAHGGAIVLADDALALPELPQREAVTLINTVPSAIAALLRLNALPASVRTVNLAGEALPRQTVNALYALPHIQKVYNLYGPSEDTTYSTFALMEREGEAAPPIGRPIANTRAYVVDDGLRLAAPGAPGELLLAGDGLARGYLNQADLTAERFIPDPFGETIGGRLYRTGDLARWLPDGQLGCLGRIDFQVKLRGFRIELGEIEARLRSLDTTQEAAAVVREDRPGAPTLTAYVTAAANAKPQPAALREALRTALPDYMVPDAVMVVDALPLTPNGKLDRKALAREAAYAPETGEPTKAVPPRTPEERMLAEIWTEVLGRDDIGAHDHFFDLGGHSLLGTRVIARVRDLFGVELPVRALFEAPVLSDLAERVGAAAKRERPPIRPVDRDQPLPLSFAQQRLWFLARLAPDSVQYHIPTALRLSGGLDAQALEAARDAVAARHESLRVRFLERDGEPLQTADPARARPLPILDLSGLPETDREAALNGALARAAARPFDLARGRLWRAALYRLGAEDHALAVVMHHIISDGWSLGVLIREWAAAYAAAARGSEPRLAPLPIQYADFALWQRRWLAGDAMQRQLDYWKNQLADLPERLELPVDRARTASPDDRGGAAPLILDAALTANLQELARHAGATPFMAVLAALGALLGRYSRQDDLAIGAPIAGRTEAALEPLIGFFVNTLVLRLRLDEAADFRALLDQTRQTTLAAYAHQETPFERLVDELSPQRSMNRTPLFQVLFTWQNAPETEPSAPGLRLRAQPFEREIAKFDLAFTLGLRDGRIAGSVQYRRDVFEPATIERLIGHFHRLLQDAVARPDHPWRQLSLWSPEARERALRQWNDTARDLPAETLHGLFERWAAETPHAPAIVHRGQVLSYGRLNARANRLARLLRDRGAGAESRVAILLERSADLAAAMLAALKAGAAYTPLDPDFPDERLALILRDAGVAAVLSDATLAQRLPAEGPPAALIESIPFQDDAEAPDAPVDGANLAYVIYTSGSTGRPKGVAISHRAAVNYRHGVFASLDLTPGMSFALVSTPAADLGLTGFLGALTGGGCLHVLTREEATDAARFQDYLASHAIDGLKITPSHLAALGADGLSAKALPRRRLILGGEAVPAPWASALARQSTQRRVFNHYGPTEATVGMLTRRIAPEEPLVAATPPLGLPIANMTAHVLEPGGDPAPLGAPGELFIGGAGLARGYWSRPDLTAVSFTPDPFSETPGARLYRSGDLVRRRADGAIEFLGRVDFQIKLRGFRVEPGEIEAALRLQDGVRDAAVMLRELAPGRPALVAYLTGAETLDVKTLRNGLAARLPSQMVPEAFVILERLPLTPNGKLDRKALPLPETGPDTAEYEAPRTPEEEILAQIWAELLGLERVGVHDHFFELGGHSLLATRVVARIRAALEVELPIRALFETPALADLARSLTRGGRRALPPIERLPRAAGRPFEAPLSFAQQRLWFLDQLEPGSPRYNIPGAARLRGWLDAAAFSDALNDLIARHESLRTLFIETAEEPVQRILAAGPYPLPMIDLTGLAEARRETAMRELLGRAAATPFDLARGPLLRAALIRLGETHHALVVVMHHIISDGWSLNQLFRELAEQYAARSQDRKGSPSPLAIQYADYAAWQRQWLTGEAMRRQLDYWRTQLAGLPERLALPTDRPHSNRPSDRGAVFEFTLDHATGSRLADLNRETGATPFMTFLAALGATLARYSRQDDLAIGAPIAGRVEAALEPLIGFFVNTLTLRLQPDPHQSFRDFLGRARQTTLDAYTHQDAPFERLVEMLQPKRSLSHTPLFQVMLAVHNTPATALETPGLRLEPLRAETASAKFDQNWTFAPSGRTWRGSLEYRADLFERETAGRMAKHLGNLLNAALAHPDAPLQRLEILDLAERRQLLEKWSGARRSLEPASPVDLIEAAAARWPDRPAVVHGGQTMTYAALTAAANRLAAALMRAGMGPGKTLGLRLERDLRLPAALLAALKTGAAYTPLDPDMPDERAAFIAGDAGLALILDSGSEPANPEPFSGRGLAWMALPPIGTSADPAPDPTRFPNPGPSAPAYIVYTSGSTGQPKGVTISRGALSNFVRVIGDYYRLAPEDRVLQFAAIGFDMLGEEIYPTLSRGAAIVTPERRDWETMSAFGAFLERTGVTTLNLPAAFWHAWLDSWDGDSPTVLPRLRLMVAGSDRVSHEHAARWRRRFPGAALHNAYGPTEATVTAVVYDGQSTDVERERGVMPIGRPLDHAAAYVLDDWLQPTPIGAPGELCIGGHGLGAGYHGQPAETAARFVPDPFAPAGAAGRRLYRTGDLAQWLPDGNLRFLGRLDFQIKLRGYRIEPGEIESRLREHPMVGEAAVLIREDDPGRRRLVAYLTAAAEGGVDLKALRGWLQNRLPSYMVPEATRQLPAMPLTPNGKIDRRALAVSPEYAPESGEPDVYTPPRTPSELILAEIWAQVLGLEQVGVHGNFFALGGHSLSAMRMLARVREAFGASLPVRTVFESPTIAEFAGRLDESMTDGGPLGERLSRTRLPFDAPLTFAQQRLWALEQLEDLGSAYHIPAAFRLDGPLDAAALARAIVALCRRHETLRTRFVNEDGQPRQRIEAPSTARLPLLDLSGLDAGDAEAALTRAVKAVTTRVFDPSAGPMFRVCLIRLAPGRHALAAVMHHLISDGWSMGVLFRDMAALYEREAADRPLDLPPLTTQYADYAAWQRQWLTDDILNEQLAYWRQRLAGLPDRLELPLDRPRPPAQTFNGASTSFEIEEAATAAIRDLAQQTGATLYMTLLAGLGALFSRYSGQRDLAIGSPVAGRDLPAVEPLIGFFINTLVMRLQLDGAPSARALIGRARQTTLEAFAHQETPFERLVAALRPARNLGHTPLFQTMLILQNAPEPARAMSRVAMRPLARTKETAQFDLTLSVRDTGARLQATLEYNTDLFEAATAERMARHWRRLLAGMAASPDTPVACLPLMDAAERHRILHDWNATDRPLPAATVHALIARQAEREPERTAAVHDGQSWRYDKLLNRAGSLAARLRAVGVGAGDRVGVYMTRSLDMLAALLGVWRAGAAYVPLDPGFPPERLSWMIADSEAKALIVDGGDAPDLSGPPAIQANSGQESPAAIPGDASLPEGPAYTIYTSGSTGKPKGVTIPHRNVVNFLQAMAREPGLEASDRLLAVTTISFDIAGLELFLPLILGAQVVLASREDALDPGRLGELLTRHEITAMQATPATWRLLLNGGWEGDPSRRLKILCGGEALSPDLAAQLLARGGSLWNLYGPTETTIWSTTRRIERAGVGGAWESVGRPIDNTRVYVVDPFLAPAPIGAAGALLIGGAGLSPGYHRRPDLTAERFIPDPFAAAPGARLYHTGDLARWLPNDQLAFLGRGDHQVKIRGFRIELGEIETALNSLAEAAEAAVIARPGPDGEPMLAAYLTSAQKTTPAALRERLRRSLPEYMIPTAWAILDALPLTPNGKVDRGALRRIEPAAPSPAADAGRDGSRSPREEALAAIWADALGREAIGLHDNFFDLGGHSLLAAQAAARIRRAFDLEAPLRLFFQAPTVRAMARALDNLQTGLATPPLEPAPRPGGRFTAPLSFAQRRLWFLEQLQPGNPVYHLPLAARISGPLSAAALETAINRLLQRHEALRARFIVRDDGEPCQTVAEASLRLEVMDLSDSGQPLARATALASNATRLRFDISRDLLLRAWLFRLGKDDAALAIVTHHIVFDGWSANILLQELAECYRAALAEQPVELPELPVQYADYAIWQRGWLRGEPLQRLRTHWLQTMQGAPPALDLPVDRPRPQKPRFDGADCRFHIDAALSARLRETARAHNATLFMALAAAYFALLRWFSGQRDIVFGTDSAHRNRVELEGLIGFFVNQLPLRARMDDEASLADLLAQTGQIALDAFAHEDFPFDMLVEALNPERSDRAPVFQVKLTLQNQPRRALSGTGPSLEPIRLERRAAQLDFLFAFIETPDGLAGNLEYNRELFLEATAQRLCDRYRDALAALADRPDAKLGDLAAELDRADRRARKPQRGLSKKPRFKKPGSFAKPTALSGGGSEEDTP